MDMADGSEKADVILDDADTKFTRQFRDLLKSEKMRPKQVAFKSPNLNAYVERFIQTIEQECLDRFVVLGESIESK